MPTVRLNRFHPGPDPSMKPFTNLAIFIFALIALLHVFRIMFKWEVMISGVVIPMWASVLGLIIAGGLALMLWKESRE